MIDDADKFNQAMSDLLLEIRNGSINSDEKMQELLEKIYIIPFNVGMKHGAKAALNKLLDDHHDIPADVRSRMTNTLLNIDSWDLSNGQIET